MAHRILFVDDELKSGPIEAIRNYLDHYVLELEESKLFTVAKADGADEAIRLLKEDSTFAAAILDVMMPRSESLRQESGDAGDDVWTGVTLAIYMHEKWPKLPIVLLSNVPSSSSSRKGLGFQEMQEKGIVREVLFKLDNTPEDVLNRLMAILELEAVG